MRDSEPRRVKTSLNRFFSHAWVNFSKTHRTGAEVAGQGLAACLDPGSNLSRAQNVSCLYGTMTTQNA